MPNTKRQVWSVTAPAMAVPFLAWLAFVWPCGAQPDGRWIIVGEKIFLALWPITAYAIVLGRGRPFVDWRARTHREALPFGALLGLAMASLLFDAMATPLAGIVLDAGDALREKIRTLGILSSYWPWAIAFSVLHSLLEEYYWRWFVFGRLTEVMPEVAAHLCAGLAFGAFHAVAASQFFDVGVSVLMAAFVAVAGIVWSWLYRRQGTLVGCWASHAVADLALFAIAHKAIFGTYL